MGRAALLKALRLQASVELKELRHDADERYAQLRKEYAVRLRKARTEQRRHLRTALQQESNSEILRCAEEQNKRLTAHRAAFEARLHLLAEKSIQNIWQSRREVLLPLLMNELPPLGWSRVRVAPSDLTLATRLFTEVSVEDDPDMRGGLIAECAERDMIADASLTTMLKRLWPKMISSLQKRIADECRQIKD